MEQVGPDIDALAAWRDALGAEHVITDPQALATAETATFATTQRVPVILRPGSVTEVQECVRIANRLGRPLYPVSTGWNWGYGSRVPARDGCALVELHRMNRILDYDETLGTVTVEPGVTFRQLHDFLAERGSRYFSPMTGSSDQSSLVGNTVERGLSIAGRPERPDFVCDLEVVLPTGELLHTGFGRFANAVATKVDRWGFGPAVDGLFFQSSLGIVTRMTLFLDRRPAEYLFVMYWLRSHEMLAPVIDELRELFLEGVLPPDCSNMSLFNDYKMAGVSSQYPWDAMGGKTPLSEELLRQLCGPLGDPRWYGSIIVRECDGGILRRRARLVRRRLKPKVDELKLVDSLMLKLARVFQRPYELFTGRKIGAALAMMNSKFVGKLPPARDVFLERASAADVFWRKRRPAPDSGSWTPESEKCGIMWIAPVVPFVGARVAACAEMMIRTTLEFGFEPRIRISCTSPRQIHVVLTLTYDREAEGEDDRAAAWYRKLSDELRAEGLYPYRLGIQGMDHIPPSSDHYDAILRRIKEVLDPNRILSPGRYGG